MKTKPIAIALFFSVSMFGLFSCVPEDSCKNCEAVTYDAGTSTVVDRQDAVEYCGNDLFLKENTDPVVVGGDSTVWECN